MPQQRWHAATDYLTHEQHVRPAVAHVKCDDTATDSKRDQQDETDGLAYRGGDAGAGDAEPDNKNQERRDQKVQQCTGDQTDHAVQGQSLVAQQTVERERSAHHGSRNKNRREICDGIRCDGRRRAEYDHQTRQGDQPDDGEHASAQHRSAEADREQARGTLGIAFAQFPAHGIAGTIAEEEAERLEYRHHRVSDADCAGLRSAQTTDEIRVREIVCGGDQV